MFLTTKIDQLLTLVSHSQNGENPKDGNESLSLLIQPVNCSFPEETSPWPKH